MLAANGSFSIASFDNIIGATVGIRTESLIFFISGGIPKKTFKKEEKKEKETQKNCFISQK